jgi:hypothetical protein
MRPLTDSQAKALRILAEGPIRPREFAKVMWPDSPAWKRTAKCGPNGAHYGGGMYTAAGGYLGRLYRDGLAHRSLHDAGSYIITRKGLDALAAHESAA